MLCGYTGKSFISGFIQTMQFVENQRNLMLKAMILFFWICHKLFNHISCPLIRPVLGRRYMAEMMINQHKTPSNESFSIQCVQRV